LIDAVRVPKIVLIEDDPDIAALVAGMLSDAGHVLDIRADLGAGSAEPGVQLVITDLLAVRSYDQEVARDWIAKVRERFPRAAILVSTAHAPAAAGGPTAIGADAVLTKPFDVGRFTETVEALLGR
jgi:DNA-binding response OmpR family regulator